MTGPAPRFGILLTHAEASRHGVAAVAQHAERLGFDLLTAWDHIHTGGPDLEVWTTLTWAAACTTRIAVAPNVLAPFHRHPLVVAKMAETLDRLSGGRLILGYGSGGRPEEAEALGLDAGSARKAQTLEEAIELTRRAWEGRVGEFDGRFFRAHGANLEPRPERRIPIWAGTYGPRAVEVTGRLADGWLPSMFRLPLDEAAGLRERLRGAAAGAGRDPDEVVCAYNLQATVDPANRSTPQRISGSAGEVVEGLAEIVRRGFTHLILVPMGDGFEQRERLAADVLPGVRQLVG
jgi:alkanesulfonate monooxygenase SsuD/methylene tetrahydromethanopterin reductase-like flavin-dependent oxidoreductase (luciferase family)